MGFKNSIKTTIKVFKSPAHRFTVLRSGLGKVYTDPFVSVNNLASQEEAITNLDCTITTAYTYISHLIAIFAPEISRTVVMLTPITLAHIVKFVSYVLFCTCTRTKII